MKKRIVAAALAFTMTMGCFVSACKDSSKEQESTEAEAEVTALSLMEQYNQGELQVTDDNYRTYYEVFVYSFYDSDGDGIGDLKGLEEKLDYINDGDDTTDTDLGCNGIWLMPIMPSTTYHKYDVIDYYDIDSEYGTLDDFKSLIASCHDRGINVIIDLVMNHSSSKNPWFTEAVSYLQGLEDGAEPSVEECQYFGYYNFSKEKSAGCYEVPGTDWYYEAQFWSEMPDLNLGNEAVRAEFEAVVDFWLDLGVDGFRLDAAKEYYSGSDEKNIEVLTWFNDMVESKKEDAFIVAEVWNDMSVYSKYYTSGISCFDFAFANSEGVIADSIKRIGSSNASSYGNQIEVLQESLASYTSDYIDAPFYTNHDMARSAGYYSGDYSENQTKIAQAMNLLMSGSAFLYYGEELGMKGSGKDENKRAPMYWSVDENAQGMCDGPQDMENVKMKYGSFEEQVEDGNSIYNYVKEVIQLRNQYPVLSHGTAEMEADISNENICVLRKTYEGEELLVIFNISETEATVDLSGIELPSETAQIGGMLLTTPTAATLDGENVTMPPYSVVIIK